MELHQAQAFLAVAREGSFTRASTRIHRSQPAVSQAVAALERELRASLFERRARKVVLSAEGEALLARLAPLVDQWESIGDRLTEDLSGAPAGQLTVGAGQTALLHLLPRAIARFRDLHPSVQVSLRHQRREESASELAAGAIDIAVRSAGEPPADAIAEPLADLPREVVASSSHPLARAKRVSWKRLGKESWVLPPAGSATRREIAARLAGAGSSLRVAVEAGGWEPVKRYVALGLGVSAVPAASLADARREGIAILDVSPRLPPERMQVWIAAEAIRRPATREFLRILKERSAAP